MKILANSMQFTTRDYIVIEDVFFHVCLVLSLQNLSDFNQCKLEMIKSVIKQELAQDDSCIKQE